MGNLVKPEGRERDRFVAEVVIAWVLTVFGAFWLCVFDVLLSGEQCSHRTWDVRTTDGRAGDFTGGACACATYL